MNDYSVELSSSAQSQIVKIRDYIRYELNNPSAAEKFLDDTEEAIDSLSQFPYAHMVRRGQNYILEMKKRQYFYRDNYCLFYVVKEEEKTVRIIRVTYSRSDLSNE